MDNIIILEPASLVPFGDLCFVLEQLSKKKVSSQEKERILTKYILEFKCKVATIVQRKNTSFFPILRLLVPSFERERGPYNLKEPKLGLLLVKVLGLNKQSHDAQRLLDRSLHYCAESDFGNVVYHVLKTRVSHKTGNLTVGDINGYLDKIACADYGNKAAILDDIFSEVIAKLTPDQVKWFIRIILKDLKLGMSGKRILSCFHPDAPEHYDTFGNLSKVCDELEDGNVRPLEMGLQIFYAVSPMLSERLDVKDISTLPPHKTYHIEEKFDGERFQIHMKDNIFEYFSRKGYAYSPIYGKTYESGLLTPHLKHMFSSQVTSFVLDGEMMGWHKEFQSFGSKGMAFDVKKLTPESRFQPCFCAFDVLYFNGRCLVGPPEKGGLPLSERLRLLDDMFRDVRGVIQHSKRKLVNTNSDIVQALDHAIDNQEEGIVVKDIHSYYIANKRNAGWYKIKPEYTDEAIDDLDLVIIGGDAATSAKQGLAKSFLVACADSIIDSVPHRWVCVGRVATGLTYDQRNDICEMLKRNWKLTRLFPTPAALVFSKAKPDFWVLPEHSIVLQVRATELIRSSEFAAPYTLRFARVKRVRDDKSVNDALTLQDFNKLVECKGPVVKLANKRLGDDQIVDFEAKPKKKRSTHAPQVPDELKKTSVGDVEVISSALRGRKLYILSDDEDCRRDELIRIVESHGGKVVANPGADTWCHLVGRATHRARSFMDTQDADVATTAWLRSLRPAPASPAPPAHPAPLTPLDLITVKRDTRLAFAREYDAFGDNYLKLTTEDTLKRCFHKMDIDEPQIYLTTGEMADLDRELFGDNNPFSFLRQCYIHLTGSTRSVLSIRARMYGATLCEIDDVMLTHIVVPSNMDPTKVQEIKYKTKALVVSEDWLEKSFVQEKLVSETIYSM